jgi:DNA-directed RNA polymerase specialized sigma24 family protein
LWGLVRVELADYAYWAVFGAIRKATIFGEVARHGRPVPRPSWLRIDKDAAKELAGETVAAALRTFEQRARAGRAWRWMECEQRRTAITTYFMTCCFLHFSNVYRKWFREQLGDVPYGLDSGLPDVGVWDDYRLEDVEAVLDRYLGSESDGNRKIVLGTIRGLTTEEIAQETNRTPDAVRSRLRGIRERFKRQFHDDGRKIEE